MIRVAAAIFFWLALGCNSYAQQNAQVIGPITPGDCALFNSNTILKDAGFACNGSSGPVVFGPATSIVGDVAIWNNTSGNSLKDVPPLQIFGTETANCIFAGPTTGSAAFPTCRALVLADIPAINLAAGNVNGGVTGLTPIANGGTNAGTQQGALNNVAPTPTRAGDLMYWNGSNWVDFPGNNSSTQVLQETSSGVPGWTTLGTGSVTSVAVAGSGGNTTSGTCTITTSGTCTVAAPGGFLNVLRNNSLTSWFHGTSVTITTAGGWCAEGIWVIPTGASVTCAQVNTPASHSSYYAVRITGNTSVTDVIVRFVVESLSSGVLGTQVSTFQMYVANSTGGTVTPTIQTKYPQTTTDTWTGTPVIDLAATNLQACTNTSLCLEAYSLTVNNNSLLGYEVNVDLGNNFSTNGKSVTIEDFDFRATPGVATGLNANPPPFEMRDPTTDTAWNQRFYQASYDNGVAPGTATRIGTVGMTGAQASNAGAAGVPFKTTMRCDPAISVWDGAGNANKASTLTLPSTWTDSFVTVTSISAGQNGFVAAAPATGENAVFHYAADCTIPGG